VIWDRRGRTYTQEGESQDGKFFQTANRELKRKVRKPIRRKKFGGKAPRNSSFGTIKRCRSPVNRFNALGFPKKNYEKSTQTQKKKFPQWVLGEDAPLRGTLRACESPACMDVMLKGRRKTLKKKKGS